MIDLSAFISKPDCQFKTRTGKDYNVKFVSAISELKLLNEQAEISTALSNWKTIKQEQLDKWKQILISILYEQENKIVKEDEKEINEMYPQNQYEGMRKLYTADKQLNYDLNAVGLNGIYYKDTGDDIEIMPEPFKIVDWKEVEGEFIEIGYPIDYNNCSPAHIRLAVCRKVELMDYEEVIKIANQTLRAFYMSAYNDKDPVGNEETITELLKYHLYA